MMPLPPIPSFLVDYLPRERKQQYNKQTNKAEDNSFALILLQEQNKLDSEKEN